MLQKQKAPRGRLVNICSLSAESLQVLFEFLFVRYRQLVAPFRAAACQYLASVCRLHALAETMNRFAAAVVRLECTFHNACLLSLEMLLSLLRQQSPYCAPCERAAKV